MGRYTRRQIAVAIILTIITIISIGMIEHLNSNQRAFIRDRIQDEARGDLSHIRAQLEAAILSDIYVLSSLTTLVSLSPNNDLSSWKEVARRIKRKSRHIKVIGLAPDDVVRFIYPLQGNEKVLGLDYRTVPKQWASIDRAREIENIFISGPVSLVQGGQALIVRIPIFTDPPNNKHYWGVCSAVISMDTLFLDAGVELFSFRYNIAIKGVDSTGNYGEIFYGDEQTFNDAFATETVHFPYGSWYIAASQKQDVLNQMPWNHRDLVRIMGYLVLATILLAFYAVYRLYQMADARALHDELTGLPNRRYFMFSLESLFNEQAKEPDSISLFAILNIDIDKFKAINDRYGHAAGDKVLVACAQRIKGALRSSDLVARIGGDEFLALLPRFNQSEEVETICVKVREAISQTPVVYKQHLIEVKASVGFVRYRDDFQSVEEMLHLADQRMYAEKREK
ncbi:diguanylate cyclase (GGDEF) domain-containing protein [Vibrio xiamenensis]|uniref:Diguanylate cyclase (GGDEF) domain-containing protein n=1 Tax=Vibrio xiamenensis TaxID=861298 RepID=A0A1G8AC31_9VIBR|nr:diguanylate cyclase [Vibrio xiamenensis]SDH18423.1 diguanylate cyclase (GGDEF) domain-containing protein [Vibrio xiamenensis]